MPKTKINLIETLFNEEQEPLKDHNETVLSILQRLAEKDLSKFRNTGALLKELTDEAKLKEKTVQDYLKDIALADVGDKEENGVDDFDLYMDLRTDKSELQLDEKQVERLKGKMKKTNLSTMKIGQLNSILSGKGNPMKPTYQSGAKKKETAKKE